MLKTKISRALCAFMSCYVANAEPEHESKRLTDWYDAEWFDDLVKIPISIDDSAIWYANLIPCLDDTCADSGEYVAGGNCIIDNNEGVTIFYGSNLIVGNAPWTSRSFDTCDAATTSLYY